VVWVLCGAALLRGQENPPERLPFTLVVETNFVSEAMQNAPFASTSLTGGQLEAARIDSLLKLPQAVPSFSAKPFRAAFLRRQLRHSRIGEHGFSERPGGRGYVDDAPFGDGISYQTDLLAVDRIEVYRGPQGSRFGKNGEAGLSISSADSQRTGSRRRLPPAGRRLTHSSIESWPRVP